VRGDVLAGEGRAGGRGCGGVPGDEAFDGVAGQGLSGPGGEQRVGGAAAALGEPLLQDGCGLPGQRGGAVFAPLPRQRTCGPGSAVKVSHLHSNHYASRRTHDLRHTAASLMIQAGYPPKMLQEIMGHASITTTLDLYGHLYPGEMDRYADRLNAAVGMTDAARWHQRWDRPGIFNALNWEDVGALGGTRTPNLLIRRPMESVQPVRQNPDQVRIHRMSRLCASVRCRPLSL
jgi:Phage integrase family